MNLLKNLAVALAMYSRIPVPQFEWKKENMRYALCFFPVVGLVIGACVFVWGKVSALLPIGDIFTAAVYLLIPVIVTGGIHLDGLLDTADALGSGQPRERKLEILKDSHAGAFAVIACCSYFIAEFGIWTEVTMRGIPVLALGFILSRALSGYGVASFPCAKTCGLAAAFAEAADRKRVRMILVIEAAAAVFFMLWADLLCGVLAAAAALLTMAWYRHLSMKQFGGITGDTQGFFLQICEFAMALAVMIGEKIPV